MASRVVAALPWFELYATPSLCLKRATTPDRSGACRGPTLRTVVRYLTSLPPG